MLCVECIDRAAPGGDLIVDIIMHIKLRQSINQYFGPFLTVFLLLTLLQEVVLSTYCVLAVGFCAAGGIKVTEPSH